MKKRVFQILDEMNVNDEANKTATVGLCNQLVEAKTSKGGGHVTMGVPAEVVQQLLFGERVAILLVLDKKEYDRIDQNKY
jgi:hypothetical protein